MESKRVGTIRRWVPEKGWGVCHSYSSGANAPEKFFFHVSNLISPDAESALGHGVKISFLVGPSRSPKELPVALEIEIVPERASLVPDNGGAR